MNRAIGWRVVVALGLAVGVGCGGGGAGGPGAAAPTATSDPALPEGPEDPGDVPPSPEVEKVQQALEKQDFAGAKALAEAAVAANPRDFQAAFYLGVAQDALGEKAAAEKSYRRALELEPRLADATINLAVLLEEGGDAKAAAEVLRAALERDPKHPRLLMNYAQVLDGAGDVEGALAAYPRAIAALPAKADFDPPRVQLRLLYAELLLAQQRKDEARAVLEQVASDDPKIRATVADALARAGAFAQCVAILDGLIKEKPVAVLHVRRGVCRHEAGDEPGAQADYRAAIALDANFAPAHYYLGVSLKADPKQKAAAKAALQKAVELDGEKGVGPRAKKALEGL